MKNRIVAIALLTLGTTAPAANHADEQVRVLREIKAPENARPLYVANRSPLLPSPLIKLPLGAISPRGWLQHQLDLQAHGMVGRLPEISPWLSFERSSWADKEGRGRFGWEEMPYWLKGYGDLAYVLKQPQMIAETKKWIDAIIASQREDGWFGPRELLTSLQGKPDLWPHMVVLDILKSWHEHSADPRVIEVMTRYFRWQHQLPPTAFGEGYWPKIRAGDNIESLFWLYNRTGERWLLELAERVFQNMARWDEGVINWHNVNIAQGFRAPGVYHVLSRNPNHLIAVERNYQTVMNRYGQFPGGGFAGDENCRPGYDDPRQGFETCGMVEFLHSFQMLTKISGNPVWSERAEEMAFNSFPAAATPDWKGLHYLTCANQVQLDRYNHAPAIENGGRMFSYTPFEVYRCCQHNVSHGWSYYAEELWLATPDRGLCASLYAPSEVSAQVGPGDGMKIHLTEETDYPFGETLRFRLAAEKPVRFPLYLRVPEWCEKPTARINGRKLRFKAASSTYIAIERTWRDGDMVELELPMTLFVRRWEKNHHAVSVHRGPLAYSLRIGEKWLRHGTNDAWPEWEVYPMTPWNYALYVDESKPSRSFEVKRREGLLPLNPFVLENVPIELRARARRLPAWKLDGLGLVGELQDSPVRSREPVEFVTLVPMGAARLRIAAFPWLGSGESAREWKEPMPMPFGASQEFTPENAAAMIDGKTPAKSGASRDPIPRFTWTERRGTNEWVEWGFPRARTVLWTEVFWADDGPSFPCRAPQSWRVLYRVGERWFPVEAVSAPETRADGFQRLAFQPVAAEGLRVEAQLQPGKAGGIFEWRISP